MEECCTTLDYKMPDWHITTCLTFSDEEVTSLQVITAVPLFLE